MSAHFAAVYGQSNLFERMFSGTFTVIPPTASMSFYELVEVDEDDVVDPQLVAEEMVDRADRELARRPASRR